STSCRFSLRPTPPPPPTPFPYTTLFRSRRQYSISLSGTAEIEVGDGTVARVGPGDVVLAEDLTGQGHVTRVVGNQPRMYAIVPLDRKSTRLNSSHQIISYAVFCLKKKKN